MSTNGPRAGSLPRWQRPLVALAQSKLGAWWFIHVGRHVDPYVLRATGGRTSTVIGAPVLLLEMIGAKSGRKRSLPLVYATDGPDVLLVASKGGAPKHPGWYHNLKANPEVEILAGRRSGHYVAREAQAGERDRVWSLVTEVYPGYDTYQQRAGARQIPVMILSPDRRSNPRRNR